MAKITCDTSHLSQVLININEHGSVLDYNEEPFLAHVEDGNLIVGNSIEDYFLG
jgi:hypothetical protein